jgi:hypothetical protein
MVFPLALQPAIVSANAPGRIASFWRSTLYAAAIAVNRLWSVRAYRRWWMRVTLGESRS